MKTPPTPATSAVAAYLAPGSSMTANDCIAALGLASRPTKLGYARELLRDGAVVFAGSVFDFNDWLRAGMPVLGAEVSS